MSLLASMTSGRALHLAHLPARPTARGAHFHRGRITLLRVRSDGESPKGHDSRKNPGSRSTTWSASSADKVPTPADTGKASDADKKPRDSLAPGVGDAVEAAVSTAEDLLPEEVTDAANDAAAATAETITPRERAPASSSTTSTPPKGATPTDADNKPRDSLAPGIGDAVEAAVSTAEDTLPEEVTEGANEAAAAAAETITPRERPATSASTSSTATTSTDADKKPRESLAPGIAGAAEAAVSTAEELLPKEVSQAANDLATAAAETVTAREPTRASSSPPPPAARELASELDIDDLKLRLLAAVASLDRGIAANVREAKEVDVLAAALEDAGGSVVLEWKTQEASPNESTMEKLGGTWRLIYSSGFNSGSLGGRRPGPPAALFPVVLGQVYQRIDNNQGKLDNIVEFLFSYPLPALPFLSSKPESPAVRLTLGHDFKVLNSNTVEITYEDTAAQFQGTQLLDSFPRLAAPSLPEPLRPPRFLRSASFDVTYLDATMRVTRGDRGELRVYLRDSDLDDAPPTDTIL